jgi:ribonuclease HI
MSFYAIAKGKKTGIFNTWAECKVYTEGYKGAIFKKFTTKEEADTFIADNTFKVGSGKVIESTKSEGANAYDILMKPKPVIEKNIVEIENSTFEPDYYVYTDGACSNNGKENAIAGIGIYFGENDMRNVSQKVIGKQTNNTAELGAILHTYNIIKPDILSGKKIGIVSDSAYAIRCATTYGKSCEKEGWERDIPNKDLVRNIYELYKDISTIKFLHIMAHTQKTDNHSIGNDHADKLANMAVGLHECPYNTTSTRIYLSVPFNKKDIIKELGGRWDVSKKQWYIACDSINKEKAVSLFKTESA